MVFLFYKFLFFLSDFLEIQRKSFYLFLNELLSQEFTKIQPLWFRQNPVYKTGYSFGTSRKSHVPMVQGGLPSDFSSAPRAMPSWDKPTTEEGSSAGPPLEARTERSLKSRKTQRSYLALAKTPKFLKEVRPSSSASSPPSKAGRAKGQGAWALPRLGQPLARQAQGLESRSDAGDLYNNNAASISNDHIVDFSYKTLTNINEIYRQNWARAKPGEGGESVIQKVLPITANDRITTIYFLSKNYKFIKPTLNIEESILFSKTYCCNFYMPVKLLDHSTNFTEMKWIFLGTLPLLTRRGHFIINGTPRIILNQIIRSSGIYFHKETTEDKKNSRLFYAEIISKSGPWVRLEVDQKKRIWVSFQQSGITRISLSHFFQNFYQKYLDHHIFLNEKKKKWNFDAILLNEFFFGGSRSVQEPQNKIEANNPIYPSHLKAEPNEATMFLGRQKSRVWARVASPPQKSRAKGQPSPFFLRCSFYFKFKKLWPKFKQLKIYSDDLSQNLYQLFSYKKYQIFNWSMFIYLKLKFSQKFTYPEFGLASFFRPPFSSSPLGTRPSPSFHPSAGQASSPVGESGAPLGLGPARLGWPMGRQTQNNQWRKKTRLKQGLSEGSTGHTLETAGSFAFGRGYGNHSWLTTKLRRRGSIPTAAQAVSQTRLKLGLDILFASSSKNISSSGGFHLDRSGRIRLNKRLGLSLKTLTLTPIDFLAISDILYRFVKGGGVNINNPNISNKPCGKAIGSGAERLDDIDDLKNRRLKTIGELLQNQLARGIQRLQKTFENTVQKDWIKFLNYQTYNSSLSFLNSFNLNRKKLGLTDRILLERSFSYSPSLKYTDNQTIYSIPEIYRQKSFFKDKSLPIPIDPILKYYFDKCRSSMSVEIAPSVWFPPKGRFPDKRRTPPVASSLGDVSLTNQVERLCKYPYDQIGDPAGLGTWALRPEGAQGPRRAWPAAGQLLNFLKKGNKTQKTNTFDLLSYQNTFQKRIFEKRNFYLQQIRKFNIFTNREAAEPLFGYKLPFLTSRISQNQLYSLLTKLHFKRNFVWKELLLYQKTDGFVGFVRTGLASAQGPSARGGLAAKEGFEGVPPPQGPMSRVVQRESQSEESPPPFFPPSPDWIRKGKAVRQFHQQKQNQAFSEANSPSATPSPGLKEHRFAMPSQVFFSTSILSIVNSLPINSTFKEFFHSHQLSQFLDQSNPLAEITHKRRLSCLGSGGITRETAGMEIRGIHLSHYGRICPIETPEGKNAGLVNSLTTTVNVDNQGFLETPYIEVYKQHYQSQKKLMFFSVEDQEIKNVFLNPKLPKLRNISVGIIKPQTQNFYKLKMNFLNLVALNPQQFLSIATTCIPFIEHDDANRALMGSNMQRQALPLIYLEQPIVTTVNAFRVLSDLKDIPTTSESGIILYVSQQKVSYYPLKKNDLVFSPSPLGKCQRSFGQSLLCDHAIRSKKHSQLGSRSEPAGLGRPIYRQVPHLSQLPDEKLAFVALGTRLFPYISFKKRGSKFGVNVEIDRPKVPLKLTIFNRSMSKQFFIQLFNNLKIDLKIQYNYKIFRIFFPLTSFSKLEKKKLTKQNINFFKIHNKF